jgi:hypothetical protein
MNDSVSADNDPLAHVTPYGSFVGIRFEQRGGPSLKASGELARLWVVVEGE